MIGLYVHFPFCRVHCSYCAFAVSTNDALQDAYFDALATEVAARESGEPIDTVYFGGGTPSRTRPHHVERIAAVIRERFALLPDAEYTMEANPEDITPEAIASWRALGINRLSIGVQSFNDRELVPLGRVHGAELARTAVKLAVDAGVRTSLDLILGLPNQDEESFRASLEAAIDLGAGHLSLYMLDLEDGSVLQRQVSRDSVKLPDDDLVAQLYVEAIERLNRSGLAQYEISNFARKGEESRHNLRYWRRDQYFGFGLGAHSFIDGRRYANTRDLTRYLDAPGKPDFAEQLTDVEEKRETIFLRLRQPAGLDYEDVVRLCGQEGVEWIEQGVSAGWLRRDGGRVALTPSGFLLSNDLISQLF